MVGRGKTDELNDQTVTFRAKMELGNFVVQYISIYYGCRVSTEDNELKTKSQRRVADI